jgi:ectoine hydroxylase-related dioxygenase (phytanoyl-CoA dioxygenase family)
MTLTDYLKKSNIFNKIIFFSGYFIFKITGKTPHYSFMAMIKLYCITRGSFISSFANMYLTTKSTINLSIYKSLFKSISITEKETIINDLNDEGYVKLNFVLDENIVKELEEFSLSTKAIVKNELVYFDVNNIFSNIYRFRGQDLLNQKTIQKLVMDPLLIEFAQSYFNSEPIFDFASMWYSTDFDKNITDDAAQYYHFDFDRPKWIKIFFYLNDVTDENGPHCYISNSHKINTKPHKLLERGYARISDSEMHDFYSNERFKEIKGKAGSIILGDTVSWHKGKPIKKGTRLIFQIQFTTSLFGMNNPKLEINNYSNEFFEFCRINKNYARNIILK